MDTVERGAIRAEEQKDQKADLSFQHAAYPENDIEKAREEVVKTRTPQHECKFLNTILTAVQSRRNLLQIFRP